MELYKVCINHDPGMTLTYFTTRSTLVAYPRSHVSVYRTNGSLVYQQKLVSRRLKQNSGKQSAAFRVSVPKYSSDANTTKDPQYRSYSKINVRSHFFKILKIGFVTRD